jgi:hypothetical protein
MVEVVLEGLGGATLFKLSSEGLMTRSPENSQVWEMDRFPSDEDDMV